MTHSEESDRPDEPEFIVFTDFVFRQCRERIAVRLAYDRSTGVARMLATNNGLFVVDADRVTFQAEKLFEMEGVGELGQPGLFPFVLFLPASDGSLKIVGNFLPIEKNFTLAVNYLPFPLMPSDEDFPEDRPQTEEEV